ncbi:MAG: 3-keto-5-aminohexanoate cleavage protein [Thermomicrobiales bacterium]|nr:3-keto-5-aminohexanoate cleavage protein [Thermomicrobiales bacterium]
MIQAALNGARRCDEHPGIPCTADELAADARACVAAGAAEIHLHPRDTAGLETLDPLTIYAVCRHVKETTRVPVGISTGGWIEPDLEKRLALIRSWYGPDYASVNCSEDGAIQVMQTLIGAGIGVEIGIGGLADVEVFARSLLVFSNAVVRLLIEPPGNELTDESTARTRFDEIHAALDRLGVMNPRLQHTDGPLAWFAIRDARDRGWDTRVGFEDTLVAPRGKRVSSNAQLVTAAVEIFARPR